MALTAAEISDLIKERIANFDVGVEARTEGTVVTLTDGIARIHGLSDVMQGEMIEFPGSIFGMASPSTARVRLSLRARRPSRRWHPVSSSGSP